MGALTFYASGDRVLMADGHRIASLTQDQADRLLDIWCETGLIERFNALHQACQDAGYIAKVIPFPNTVSARVNEKFRAAVADTLRTMNHD